MPRIDAWNSDTLPFNEPGLLEAVQVATGRTSAKSGRRANLFFSTDVDECIRKADLIYVAVETPSGKRDATGHGAAPNLTSFHAVLKHIAKTVVHDFILVNKSTVPCGSADATKHIIRPFLRPGVKCQILSNPEFLAEGTAVSDLLHPDRIVIGCDDSEDGLAAAEMLGDLYRNWVSDDKIIVMNSRASELTKLAANCLLAQRISSINALSAICDKVGADVTQVSRACGLDKRIGKHMLRSTLGFGGSCFEKDVLHLTNTAAQLGLPNVASFFESIITINTFQTSRFTQNIMNRVPNGVSGRRIIIGVLGFAFKPETDDTRCSPAIQVIRELVTAGYQIQVFDPLVEESKIRADLLASFPDGQYAFDEQVTVCDDVYEACEGANGVAVLNSWSEMQYVPAQRETGFIKSFGVGKNMISKQPQDTIVSHSRTRNGSDVEEWSLTCNCTEVSSVPVGERVNWNRIADNMHSPRYVFDGVNFLDARLNETGLCIDSIGRPVRLPGPVVDGPIVDGPLVDGPLGNGPRIADISEPEMEISMTNGRYFEKSGGIFA